MKALGRASAGFDALSFRTPSISLRFCSKAQSSQAKVVALAGFRHGVSSMRSNPRMNCGQWNVGQTLAGLLVWITEDIKSLGLETAQGLVLTERILLGPRRRNPGMVASASSNG